MSTPARAKSRRLAVWSAAALLAATAAAEAGNARTTRQTDVVNVSATVTFGNDAPQSLAVRQTGLLNFAGYASFGASAPGYLDIYQRGASNSAIVHQSGPGSVAAIVQGGGVLGRRR